ncbi:MAG TPA: DUF3810 domain-containing protein [Clostridiaceae bacterium]|nr:DUF3810 domain-containing protein [Clostridiaceae bacterium]
METVAKVRNHLKENYSPGYGILWIVMVPVMYLISLLSRQYPQVLETYYSSSVNKAFISLLSQLTGMIPVSIGEVLFVFFVLFMALRVVSLLYSALTGGFRKKLYRTVVLLAAIYVLFMGFWGLNYNRVSVREMAGLTETLYTKEELYGMNKALISKVNDLREAVTENREGVMVVDGSRHSVLRRARAAYDLTEDIGALDGTYGVPKPIGLSDYMLYTGITGIYMPFTGEANVNIAVPDLLLPATVLHEMAHQRGIAYEDEANYVAYHVAANHPDADFRYSGALLGLMNAMNALRSMDKDLFEALAEGYSDGLRRDLVAYNAFWKDYEGQVEETATRINDGYLKGNGQVEGVRSYGMMVDLLLERFYQKGTL